MLRVFGRRWQWRRRRACFERPAIYNSSNDDDIVRRPVCSAEFIASRCRLSSRLRRPTVLARAYLGGSAYRHIDFSGRVSRGGDRDGLVLHTRRTRRRWRQRRRRQLRTTSVPEHERPTLSRPRFESDERVNNKNGMINISAPIGARGGYVTRAPRPPGRKTNNLLGVEPYDTINGKFLSNFSSDRDVISAPSIYPPVSGKG